MIILAEAKSSLDETWEMWLMLSADPGHLTYFSFVPLLK